MDANEITPNHLGDSVLVMGDRAPIAPQGPTLDQMRQALRDPETPVQVKRIIHQHLYGRLDGRREIGHVLRTSGGYKFTPVPSGARRLSTEPKRPAGMTGRQFKKMRKRVLRDIRDGETLE
jgi:hypothetical protein